MGRTTRNKTVNQLLELLSESFSAEHITQDSKLSKLKEKLVEIKFKTINGGIVMVKNSDEISDMLVN